MIKCAIENNKYILDFILSVWNDKHKDSFKFTLINGIMVGVLEYNNEIYKELEFLSCIVDNFKINDSIFEELDN